MDESEARVARRDLLDVFERVADEGEPLTATAVADAAGCSRRTARDGLDELAEQGALETKTVGEDCRVWWRPRPIEAELTADRVRRLEYRSQTLAEPFLEAADDERLSITIDSVVALDDGTELQYYTAENVAPDAYVAALESFSTVRDVRLLSTVDDTVRVEARTAAETIVGAFAAFDGRTTAMELVDGVFHVEGHVPAPIDPQAVTEAVRAVHPDVRLAAQSLVYTPRLLRDVVESDLTDCQSTALESAYYAGYFDSPRRSTGAELADHLGVTRQTFNYHLRNAESVVLEKLYESSADPVL